MRTARGLRKTFPPLCSLCFREMSEINRSVRLAVPALHAAFIEVFRVNWPTVLLLDRW